jgi:hypothetical protein
LSKSDHSRNKKKDHNIISRYKKAQFILKGLIFAMAIAKSQYMDLPCVNTNRFTTGEELI